MNEAEAPIEKQAQAQTPKQKKKGVKIKVNHTIRINGKNHRPGEILEVDEATANEFCKSFRGSMSFAGERSSDDVDFVIVRRAERVE